MHIQRLGGEPNPNRVMTPTAVISVRGTIFDVSINDDDETTIVSVEEGSVEVRHALKPGASKIVNAGESLHVYKDEPLAKSMIDKNELVHRIVRGLGDAAYRIAISPPVAWGSAFRLARYRPRASLMPPAPPTTPPPAGNPTPTAPPPASVGAIRLLTAPTSATARVSKRPNCATLASREGPMKYHPSFLSAFAFAAWPSGKPLSRLRPHRPGSAAR